MKKLLIILLFPLICSGQLVPENYIWADTTDNLVLTTESGVAKWKPSSSGGETNTMSNINTLGIGLYHQKSGVNFEIRGLRSASTLLNIGLDASQKQLYINLDNDLQFYDNSVTNFTTGAHSVISNAVYSGSWNGNTTDGATKNALYDKINAIKEGIWNANGSDIYYSIGYVGINTSTPTKRFTIYENSSSAKIPMSLYNNGSGNLSFEMRNNQNSYSIGVKGNDFEIYDNGFGQVFLAHDNGDIQLSQYSNSDDYTGIFEPDNVLYLNSSGKIMVKPEPISFTTMTATTSSDEWNSASWSDVDLQTNSYDEGTATTGSTSTDRININATGTYELIATLEGVSTGTDVAIEVDFWIGNSQIGTAQVLYVSGANSINKGSVNLSYIRRISAGSYIRLRTKRLGSNTTSLKRASGSKVSMSVTRIRINN